MWLISWKSLTVVPPPASHTNKISDSLKMAGDSLAICTAAASASVNPIPDVWFGCCPNPARAVRDLKRSTVGCGFHVVGTLKINSIFASLHGVGISSCNLASMY